MHNKPKPWRSTIEIDTQLDSPEEIRNRITQKVAKQLGQAINDVDLVFCGLDGDEISPNNLPPLTNNKIHAMGIDFLAGDEPTVDPLEYAEDYTHPALVIYDRNKLDSQMGDHVYEGSHDAVVGVLFIEP